MILLDFLRVFLLEVYRVYHTSKLAMQDKDISAKYAGMLQIDHLCSE